ncbi:NYN domain-containing protein [Blastococcus sp. URHD0036]|uniref:NYN domain-containing protein n=1 Tax=Blastococcus sp. URHD0036 TaxID=1380356 RepID=UPI0004965A23|nr:NYN domain-containing protein [Blastococcus sp. URHD0036]
MGTGGTRIALLVDAENAPAAALGRIVPEASVHGSLVVRRAYGDWTTPQLAPWTAAMRPLGVQAVQQSPCSSGKNAVDMAIVVDAMDLFHARAVDAFALVSSDADFTPLVLRLVAGGARVHGFGEAKAPAPFVAACTRFTVVQGARGHARLVTRVLAAVEATRRDDGWAPLSTVGHRLRASGGLDPRAHGHRRLSELVQATGRFELRREGLSLLVRAVRAG